MKTIARLIVILLSIAYPFMVYWGLQAGAQILLFCLMLVLLGIRLWLFNDEKQRLSLIIMALIVVLFSVSSVELGLKLYPVLVNLSFFILFAASLVSGQPIIERFARLKHPDLPEYAVQYTRQVTQAWCWFFLLNGSVSAITAVMEQPQLWLWYNGVIAYILIGIMFAGEWWTRRQIRAKYEWTG